jgi:NAD-dependent DNA ligase
MRAFLDRLGRMLESDDEAIPLMAEPKLDGAGVELVYEKYPCGHECRSRCRD